MLSQHNCTHMPAYCSARSSQNPAVVGFVDTVLRDRWPHRIASHAQQPCRPKLQRQPVGLDQFIEHQLPESVEVPGHPIDSPVFDLR